MPWQRHILTVYEKIIPKQMAGWLGVCIYGWMHGCMDAWMHGWMDRWDGEVHLYEQNERVADRCMTRHPSPTSNLSLKTTMKDYLDSLLYFIFITIKL